MKSEKKEELCQLSLKEEELTKLLTKRRKIKSLTVIHGHVAPGILKPNDNVCEASHRDIQMFLCDNFVEVIFRGETVGIPFSNIKGWVFDE